MAKQILSNNTYFAIHNVDSTCHTYISSEQMCALHNIGNDNDRGIIEGHWIILHKLSKFSNNCDLADNYSFHSVSSFKWFFSGGEGGVCGYLGLSGKKKCICQQQVFGHGVRCIFGKRKHNNFSILELYSWSKYFQHQIDFFFFAFLWVGRI